MKISLIWIYLLLGQFLCFGHNDPLFIPKGLEARVQFWKKVFSQYSINQIIIHDADEPERVYRVLDFRTLDSKGLLFESVKRDSIDQCKKEIRQILRKLVSVDDTSRLSTEEKRVRGLFGDQISSRTFRKAMLNVHAQKGAMETFKAGLVRSGRYAPAMKAIFKEQGLPEDLVYLAHVESSFHPKAKSPAGAVGVWQFMLSTGKKFLNINSLMDERRDPILSSRGAATLLKSNYDKTGSWPLAVTAYNHGVNGISRAVASKKSKDLFILIKTYESSLWGYASKNFYVEFLAARNIASRPTEYFPEIILDSPIEFKMVALPFSFSMKEAATMFKVDPQVLADMNPALKQAVTVQNHKIPRGYLLRVPIEANVLGASMIGSGMGVSISGF